MAESFLNSKQFKRVKTICRLSPSLVASVKCIKLNCGRCITVLSAGNRFLQVMENHKISFIIDVGSPVLKVLDYVNERNKIYVVTKDGKLWGIPIPLPHNKQTNQPTSSQAAKSGPNHEIFAELLGDQPHSSADQTHPHAPFSNVYKCSDDDVIYWEPSLKDVVIGPHHIITCCSTESEVRLTVYPWMMEQDDAEKRQIPPNFLYQTLLPRDVCNYSNNDVTKLSYLSSSGQISSKCANTLNQVLCNSLFNGQSGPNCPIALVGLRSGLVGYIHVGVKNRNPGKSNLETLYHLEQPVLSMFSVCLKPPSPMNAQVDGDTLCVLGTLGKLVLITQDNSSGQPDSTVIQEYHVPGPIVCAAVTSNLSTFFYSTLKEVYAVQFRETKIENKSTSEVSLPSSLSPRILNIPKIEALSTDETSSLICLKTDGRVLLVSQPLDEEISRSSLQGGDLIKKHLEEIHEKASEVKNLRDEIRQLDEVIKQLNIATRVLCEILRSRESPNDIFVESGIFFKVGVDYEEQGANLYPRVILRCDLVNSTKFSFSSHWSLVVQLCISQPWFNEECSIQATINHSVSLSPASSHHISIPLEETFSYLNSLQVSCYVCCGLEHLLPVFLKDSEPALSEEGFSVLVSSTELNILNFLRKQETNSSVIYQHRQIRHPAYFLQSTFKSVSVAPNKVSRRVQETSSEFSTFSIRLSKEAVGFIESRMKEMNKDGNETFPKTNVNPNPRDSKDCLSTQEACVLHYLLRGSTRHLDGNGINYCNGHVVARTPNEEVVKFQVVSQAGTTQGIEGLEVRVHTSSQALACSVHSSLLKVLKPAIERTPPVQKANVPVGELQKQLMKLKVRMEGFNNRLWFDLFLQVWRRMIYSSSSRLPFYPRLLP